MSQIFEIDPAMVKGYLNRRASDLEALRSALAERRFEIISNFGHQWKGNADSFGFPMLAQFGRNLEDAADASDTGRVQSLISEIESFVRTEEEKIIESV